MTQTALVTGAAGFAGRYMCQYMRSVRPDIKIVGVDIQPNMDCLCDDFSVLDIIDGGKTKTIIEKTKPDFILHLAGTFGVDDVQNTYRINILSITAILEAMREIVPSSVLVTVGSAAEYGRVKETCLPVTEDTLCSPVTPYGLSKYMATQVAAYYHCVHELCAMTIRPFQLIGKGVTDRLAPGAFAKQLMKANEMRAQTISVGNLESSRDFLDIHDAVRAIWCLCENPVPGETFNLCSGTPTKISILLETMISVSGMDVNVEIDPSRMRGGADVSTIYGSCEKLYNHCGWRPQKTLRESIVNMFE